MLTLLVATVLDFAKGNGKQSYLDYTLVFDKEYPLDAVQVHLELDSGTVSTRS